jgi:superfamily II DNA or RNA helicase
LTEIKTSETSIGKELYGYQKDALQEIFERFETAPQDYHLLYQLPTGGGKTVIFSEILKRLTRKF